MQTDPTSIILWQSLAIFLHIAALLGILFGLLLIFKPDLMERINRVANRWISMRHIERLLDHSISIEHWFYRHHRVLGIAIVLGAVYIIIYFGFLFDKAYALQYLSSKVPAILLDIPLDVLVLFLLFGAAVALIAGLFVWLRPVCYAALRQNQWCLRAGHQSWMCHMTNWNALSHAMHVKSAGCCCWAAFIWPSPCSVC